MNAMRRLLLPCLALLLLAPAFARAADFMAGADVSMLAEVERHGGKFSSADGKPGDAMQILKDAGVTWVRLRLWHTPVFAADVVEDGRVVLKKGTAVGGGNNGLATTMRLARRARALGLKVLLDIHYSDFWADPQTQTKPAAWTDLHGDALRAAVREYTADTLDALDAVGASPDMVQVGNETNAGMLWPDGQTWSADKGAKIGGDAAFAALLRAAIEGVRANDARNGRHLPVMVHLAGGTDPDLCHHMLDLFAAEKLDYDVVGLSWYPIYHGTLAQLKANLDELAQRYRKPLVVVETAYGWTLENGQSGSHLLDARHAEKAGYPATVAGQAQVIHDVIATVAAVPDGLGRGVFYWEPDWIPAAGAGWRTGADNNWENQALFDYSGRALPSMNALRAPH